MWEEENQTRGKLREKTHLAHASQTPAAPPPRLISEQTRFSSEKPREVGNKHDRRIRAANIQRVQFLITLARVHVRHHKRLKWKRASRPSAT